MSLEVFRVKCSENSHENKQFRRVALIISNFFEKNKHSGILIANPEHFDIPYFYPDALLCWDKGILLIDFKEYSGILYFDEDFQSFSNNKWQIHLVDGSKIDVHGGGYKNPFKQLATYRYSLLQFLCPSGGSTRLKKIIQTINIFKTPLSCSGLPHSVRGYFLTDEDNLEATLYDMGCPAGFEYSKELGFSLKKYFSAQPWESFSPKEEKKEISSCCRVKQRISFADQFFDDRLKQFVKSDEGVLILTSPDYTKRDSWVRYIFEQAPELGFNEGHIFVHSNKIAKIIQERIFDDSYPRMESLNAILFQDENSSFNLLGDPVISVTSLKNEILPSASFLLNLSQAKDDIFSTDNDDTDDVEDVVTFKEPVYEDNSLLILHEVHLITRTFYKSDQLGVKQKGSGRLLDDFISQTKNRKNIKIIAIGDPCSLSYGNHVESAIVPDAYKYTSLNAPVGVIESTADQLYVENGLSAFKRQIANSIDNKNYTIIHWQMDADSLISGDDTHVMKKWIERGIKEHYFVLAKYSILVSTKEMAFECNTWIRRVFYSNYGRINKGDILCSNSNKAIRNCDSLDDVYIEDGDLFIVDSVLGDPLVEDGFEVQQIEMHGNGKRVCCWIRLKELNDPAPVTTQEMREAYARRLNQQIAIHAKKEWLKLGKSFAFEEERKRLNDSDRRIFDEVYRKKCENFSDRQRLPVVWLQNENIRIRKSVKSYILKTDPFLSALYVKWGWAHNVHKIFTKKYEEVYININSYHTNKHCEDYFRWLYSGISVSSVVFLRGIPQVTPWDAIEGFTEALQMTAEVRTKKTLLFDDKNIEEPYASIVNCIDNKNVRGIVWRMLEYFESVGLVFDDYIVKGDYHSVLAVRDKINKYMIDVYTKGEKEKFAVSNVEFCKKMSVPIKYIKLLSKLLNELRDNTCCEKKNSERKTNLKLIPIYNGWKLRLGQRGITLALEHEFAYQDIFTAFRGKDHFSFRIIYGKNGLISHAAIISGKKGSFTTEVEQIIFSKDIE